MPESAPFDMPDLLLVVGSPRSGTTLMHHMLASDPLTLSIPYEAKFLSHHLNAYRLSKEDFAGYNHAFFSDPAEMREHSRRFFAGIFSELHQSHSVPILLFKDPAISLSLHEALELFPDARCVLMLRDPRDIVASLLEVGKRLETAGADYGFGLKNLPGVIHYALKHYGPAYELMNQASTQGRILPVLYERLVTHPEAELERLREFTGLMLGNYHPGQSWSGEVPADTPIQHAWTSELYGQPVSASRVGIYKRLLSPEAIQLIEANCQAFMQIFGYQS